MSCDSPLLDTLRKDSRKEEDIWEALWNFTSDYSKDSNCFLIVLEDLIVLWKWHLKDGHKITGLYMGCYNDYFSCSACLASCSCKRYCMESTLYYLYSYCTCWYCFTTCTLIHKKKHHFGVFFCEYFWV